MTSTLYKSNNPPIKGSTWNFDLVLYSQSDTKLIQTSVPLVAGDVIVYKDGVLDGNIDALPTEIGTSGVLNVALSASEMDANRVSVKFHDVTGTSWCDCEVSLDTVTAQTVGSQDNPASVTVSSIGADVIDAASIKADAVTKIQAGLSTLTVTDIFAGVVEGTITIQQAFRLMLAVLAGKSTGGGTVNVAFRDVADTKNRIDATVDANGNRTAVTRDGS